MLRWTFIFIVLAIITAYLGFGGIVVDISSAAKILCLVFIGLFVVSLIIGLKRI